MIRTLSILALLAASFAMDIRLCPAAGPSHMRGYSNGYRGGSYQSGGIRVPSGRTYYNGKYYGNFNNRFYGPQYGYF